jgi:RHS repeat-associated protein
MADFAWSCRKIEASQAAAKKKKRMTTTTELSEKPHQGVEGFKAVLYPASTEDKSNTASGLPVWLWRKGTGSRSSGKERDETGLDYFGARYYSGPHGRFISADNGIDQHPLNPQSWNLYAYARNNPITLVDPNGRYVCGGSMTLQLCEAFHSGLEKAQNATNNIRAEYGADSDEYIKAQRAIDAYGKPGVDNGVTIEIGDTGKYGAITEILSKLGAKTSDNPAGQKIKVIFSEIAIDNMGTVGHEGVHVADATAWIASDFSDTMNPTQYQGEMDAYAVNALLGNGSGYIITTMTFGENKYMIAAGKHMNVERQNYAIREILKREYDLHPTNPIKLFKKNTEGGSR